MTLNAASRRDLLHVLRNLHRRDLLAASVLVDAPFVRLYAQSHDESPAVRLRDAIVRTIHRLAEDPIDRPAAMMLEAAFVVMPRRKQLALASDLGMGFSTYRRHLARAIDALVDVLSGDAMRRTREPFAPSMDDAPEPCAPRIPALPNTRSGPRPLHARSR